MALAVVYSRASLGIAAPLVTVEADLSNGLPGFSLVGLPETAVKESKDRVRSAILNAGFEFPGRRVTINLAPADLPKEGGRFDLAIAVGILAASGQIHTKDLHNYEFLGELGLDGELRPVCGALSAAMAAGHEMRAIFVPQDNAHEAALTSGAQVYPLESLQQLCYFLGGQQEIAVAPRTILETEYYDLDLAEVQDQQRAKRALEIAAAGGHSMLMVGPPGTGKTMLAARLPTILPPLYEEEALEVAAIHSTSARKDDWQRLWGRRPFRAPHHTASAVALVGGGSRVQPGEISLAHHGVLFLDELPEFPRKVLEVLREPLENGRITISRAARQAEYPARFQLIAAMNPCPCGHSTNPNIECHCTVEQVRRYRGRISGPLLDRIDIHLEVPALSTKALLRTHTTNNATETSATVRVRVAAARMRQIERQHRLNFNLSGSQLTKICKLNTATEDLLEQATQRLQLSARAFHRVLRVARTIADLETAQAVEEDHLREALSFRPVG